MLLNTNNRKNESMELVLNLIDMGILPMEDKDEIVTPHTEVETPLWTDFIEGTKPWEEHCNHKHHRANRRRQNRLHKKTCIRGKVVKTYGNQGKKLVNHQNNLVDKQLFLNGKLFRDARDTEAAKAAVAWGHEVEAEETMWRIDTPFNRYLRAKWIEEEEFEFVIECKSWSEIDFFFDNLEVFADKEVHYGDSSHGTYNTFEDVNSLDWISKFKGLLSVEEILNFLF
jgi:hypothetical protein